VVDICCSFKELRLGLTLAVLPPEETDLNGASVTIYEIAHRNFPRKTQKAFDYKHKNAKNASSMQAATGNPAMKKFRFSLGLIARLGIAAGFSYLAYKVGGGHKDGLVLLVISAPVWGVLLAKPILEFVNSFVDFAKKQPYVPWQGRYYEFQGKQIRIFEDDGVLWFVDRDVLRVLDKAPTRAMRIAYGEVDYKPVEEAGGMAFSERVVLRVVSLIRHPDAGKFKFWIEREVIAPHHKKREIAGLRAPSR